MLDQGVPLIINIETNKGKKKMQHGNLTTSITAGQQKD
jgi:hypothetical protein